MIDRATEVTIEGLDPSLVAAARNGITIRLVSGYDAASLRGSFNSKRDANREPDAEPTPVLVQPTGIAAAITAEKKRQANKWR